MKKNIFLGNTPLNKDEAAVDGCFVEIQGEKFYKITNYDQMPDFFMTIVSHSDHWMFISSNGALSAGRKDRDNALFPYYTDDKIHDYCGITGSKTIVMLQQADKTYLWQPFSKSLVDIYSIERNIYKNEYGNKIIFEEVNNELGISFKYSWSSSERFGFVKHASISNLTDSKVKAEILDGIANILPGGVYYAFQNEYSNLLDGYKKNELLADTGLGLFMLSSIPVDSAEPSESLNATTVWSAGLDNKKILLSDNQLEQFRRGLPIQTEFDIKATRGSYYVVAELALEAQQSQDWIIVSEINQSSTEVANLNQFLCSEKPFTDIVDIDIQKGTSSLVNIVATADGLQASHEELCSARHFSNTLFNIMRGGTYLDGYTLETRNVKEFIKQTNLKLSNKLEALLLNLPQTISYQELLKLADKTGDSDLIRICYEYLPLTFSRRHGDPSRPWNLFSIDNKNEDGSAKSDFQGNWRDIFQNWEALSLSYPGYIENIISKFVNASTADGYNPYRIMRSGIDWECPSEDEPWAGIGYWGDHQIVYLQSLIELSDKYHPGKIDELLSKEIFVYANVPYRINSYADIVKNPQNTIEFDAELNDIITRQVEENGADGRLLMQADKSVYHVNLTEKILVTLLAKLSNFVPEAGIWLNTQRPEWNDANNALVGNGVSMVTLYYMHRFVKFWSDKFSASSTTEVMISEEVKSLFDAIYRLFVDNKRLLQQGFDKQARRRFIDTLGTAGANYRNRVYNQSFSADKEKISSGDLHQFMQLTKEYLAQSIRANKRQDGLYHAYNLITFDENAVSIRHLYEMLEGQVAILSAGFLSTRESLEMLDQLKVSSLFRQDQYSYILYPDRELPRFIEKNNIPQERVRESKLLTQLVANNDNSILSKDQSGGFHFNSSIRNSDVLLNALSALDENCYKALVEEDKTFVLSTYEEIFDHQSFTGRSGTFYAYEGLGSIYWHMVSKLLLAVEGCYFNALDEGAEPCLLDRIKAHYYEIKAGIGLYKNPKLYGAFPTDAYSHTPATAGAKQPGMTGQVKEDVISRMGELGVRVIHGAIRFDTRLINRDEFLQGDTLFDYISLDGVKQQLALKPKQLAFTLCQVPVVYTLADAKSIQVIFKDGTKKACSGDSLDQIVSRSIFERSQQVERVEVSIN